MARSDAQKLARRTAKFGEAPPGFKFTAKGELVKGGIGEGGFLKKIGGFAKKAAPFAAFAGLGPLGGLALGAGGSLLSGGGLKGALKAGAVGGLGGLAGKAVGGVGGLTSRLGGTGGIGGLGSSALDFIKNNPELLAGGISAIQNARTQGKRDDIRDELLGNVRTDRARRQGFLDQIDVGSLRDLQAPDLGQVFSDVSNPFARSSSPPRRPARPRRPRERLGGLAKQGGVGSAVRGV